jgi:DNA-binding NarL/FixJ family response regulator
MRDAFVTILVEPNALFREGLSRILRAARFRIVNSAPLIDHSTLEMLADHENVLLVIGSGHGADAAAKQIELFKERYLTARVAVVADCYRQSDVLSVFRAGANAYFVQATSCDAFVRTLNLVMLGQTFVPAEILPFFLDHEHKAITPFRLEANGAATITEHAHAPHLSTQEKRILDYLIEGDSNKIIARKIDIAEATVKVHIKAILRKIQVRNRTQAAIWAMHNGSSRFEDRPKREIESSAVLTDSQKPIREGLKEPACAGTTARP